MGIVKVNISLTYREGGMSWGRGWDFGYVKVFIKVGGGCVEKIAYTKSGEKWVRNGKRGGDNIKEI